MTNRELLRTLFVGPFRRRKHGLYVWDAKNRMVACPATIDGGIYIPRGWGRIQCLSGGSALMDQWEVAFEEIVGTETDQAEVIRKLNEAAGWGDE